MYTKVKDGNVIAYDCDDTLVSWNIPNDYDGPVIEIESNGFIERVIPNTYVIDHLKKVKRRCFSVVVWSAAGSTWAENVVKALKLEDFVDVVMPKLFGHMDDKQNPVDKLGVWGYIDFDGNVFIEENGKKVKTGSLKNNDYGKTQKRSL